MKGVEMGSVAAEEDLEEGVEGGGDEAGVGEGEMLPAHLATRTRREHDSTKKRIRVNIDGTREPRRWLEVGFQGDSGRPNA